LNAIQVTAEEALAWLIEEGIAESVTALATATNLGVQLDITIKRPRSAVEHKFFDLWQQTGV
jgi:phage gp46-like protein